MLYLLDFDQRCVTVVDRVVDLTPTEYQLLEVLARHAGRTVPTERLLIEVWGPEYAGEVKHVKHFVWSLRKKIEADRRLSHFNILYSGDPKHIVTERGFGYRLE